MVSVPESKSARESEVVISAPAEPLSSSFIVDSHVHVFPKEMRDRRSSLVESDYWFGELYCNPLAQLAGVDDLIASMDHAGIDRSVLCGFPFSDPQLCREHNAYMLDCQRRFPERIAWLGTLVPQDESTGRIARECLESGASGIGELNADGQGFRLEQPESLAELVEVCRSFDVSIMFHVSEPVGHQYSGKGTATPEKLLRFLDRYPEVGIVAAHWGGGLPFYELMPEVAEQCRNVVYDSAATTYLYRSGVFKTVIDLAGSRRAMFGSDYPVLRQDRLLRRIDRLELLPDVRRNLLGQNAARVFGLETANASHRGAPGSASTASNGEPS